MTNTDTNLVDDSLNQCLRMIGAGAELVRLTTQGKREVENLAKIRKALRGRGIETPVVADIHFNPKLALSAATVADKIRINPGNYLRGGAVETLLPELLKVCRDHGTAIRIGINHGSLAEPILREYGDTPRGMVESAMQFLRICRQQDMDRVVVSMKSSNPGVMIRSVRLLARTMAGEGLDYPLHLGVTEAGDGMGGRIKSVVGMAPLLLDGLGDTIRVSLTEPPEEEMPVARKILKLFQGSHRSEEDPFSGLAWDPFTFTRRNSREVNGIGNGARVKIISSLPPTPGYDVTPEQVAQGGITYEMWRSKPGIADQVGTYLLLEHGGHNIREVKARLNEFSLSGQTAPVVYHTISSEADRDLYRLKLAGELGYLLVDGAIDAVWAENPHFEVAFINETLLTIFQAAGVRVSRTEYIACPSCGRTHFDILTRLKEIREATSHLVTLKIGVMGCIVNGPGEMADADYGYVGAAKGKVTLYKGREERKKGIPENEALAELINLIKEEGDWSDPPVPDR